jgi:hypothetical protein
MQPSESRCRCLVAHYFLPRVTTAERWAARGNEVDNGLLSDTEIVSGNALKKHSVFNITHKRCRGTASCLQTAIGTLDFAIAAPETRERITISSSLQKAH